MATCFICDCCGKMASAHSELNLVRLEYDLYVIAIDTFVVEVVAQFGTYKAGYIHSFTRNVVV